jgi:hypothetical protein
MTSIMTPLSLSHGDELIVNSVFDPENSPDTPSVKIDPQLPPDPKIQDLALLKQLQTRELTAIRLVEQFSINSTSQPSLSPLANPKSSASLDDPERHGVYMEALGILSSLIDEHPDYASAYNNRAQLRRWRYGDKLLSPSDPEELEIQTCLDAIINDLDTAAEIAGPHAAGSAVSPNQAKLLSQTWTQRGAIFWGLAKRANNPRKVSQHKQDNDTHPEELKSWTSWDSMRLEEEGSRSFFMAGLFGSEIGRTMAVKTNPYARLCAGIVKEAMRGEYGV